MYLSCGLAALTYLHLDCIDGKQARRTKSSSPLGQLFDHGECLGHMLALSCAEPAATCLQGPDETQTFGAQMMPGGGGGRGNRGFV